MAVLTTNEVNNVLSRVFALFNREGLSTALPRASFKTAIVALDAFLDTNATAINNTLPADAKAEWTPKVKAAIMNEVMTERYGAL